MWDWADRKIADMFFVDTVADTIVVLAAVNVVVISDVISFILFMFRRI